MKKPQHQQSVSPESTSIPAEGDESVADEFERKHVHSVYSDIATHFSATRHTAWPLVSKFVERVAEEGGGGMILDVGCGNGKYLRGHKFDFAVGLDTCAELVDVAAKIKVNIDVAVGDALRLPMRDGMFDAVICVAVIHHLCTRERRVAALRECVRVARPNGGQALFYVWSQDKDERVQSKSKMMNRKFDAQDMLIPWHLRKKKDGANDDKVLGDWHQVHRRFYHIYQKGELEDELSEVDGISVTESYFDHQNWCAVVTRE